MKLKRAASISFFILTFSQIDAFGKIYKHNHKQSEELTPKITTKKSSYNSFPQIEVNRFINYIANNIDDFPVKNKNQLKSFQILSNIQLRTKGNFIAEGDVMIQNGGSIIVAEKFEYDYKSRKISLKGNIKFSSKGQFFEASEFNYDLNNKTGFFKDIFGSINFESLDFIKLEKEIDPNVTEDVFLDTEIPTTDEKIVRLYNSGGINGMRWTIFLTIAAMVYGGSMEAIGALKKITNFLCN